MTTSKNRKSIFVHLGRRSFLKGIGGVSIALPMMGAGRRSRQLSDVPPKRLFTFSFPNGCDPEWWNFEKALSPLQPWRSHISVLGGLANGAAADLSVSGDDHEKGGGTMFVGRPLRTRYNSGGESLDVYLNRTLGPQTPCPHVATGVWRITGEFEYLPTWYSRSWRQDGNFVPSTVNPLDLFYRLFNIDKEVALKYKSTSILDNTVAHYNHMLSGSYGLSIEGRRVLVEHLEQVRALELRVKESNSERLSNCEHILPDSYPSDPNLIPYSDWRKVFRLQVDLLAMSIRCDLTRFGSLIFGSAAATFQMDELGPGHHHHYAHNPQNLEASDYFLKSRRYHMEDLAYLLSTLSMLPEGDGNALDNTAIVVATEMGKPGPTHHRDPVPHLVAGGRNFIRQGQILDFGGSRHTNDVYLTMCHSLGLKDQSFGNPEFCSGPIPELLLV